MYPPARQTVRQAEPGLLLALVASFFIHLLVAGFAYYYSFGSNDSTELSQDRASIEIIFTERMSPTVVSGSDAENAIEVAEPEATGFASETETAPEAVVLQSQEPIPVDSHQRQRELNQPDEPGDVPRDSLSKNFSNAELNASVASFMQSYQQGLKQNWLEECTRFEKQNSLAECPLGQEYSTSLNPVTVSLFAAVEPVTGVTTSEFSAQESFIRMTEEDIFNPYLLSGEIVLLGTGGGAVNGALGFLANSLGFTALNKAQSFSIATELKASPDTTTNDAGELSSGEESEEAMTEVQEFVLRPSLF